MSRGSPFEFDVFLSYGWADIAGPTEGDRGWVGEFKQQLQLNLNGELGQGARIFLDIEQPSNGELKANLSRAIQSSAVFLGVITPGSCREDSWCRWEVNEFFENSISILPNRRQVFLARLRNVPPHDWPELIRPIASYEFLTENHFPVPRAHLSDTSKPGGERLQKLAHDIAEVLKELNSKVQRTMFCGFASGRESMFERLANEAAGREGTIVKGSYVAGESEAAFTARTAGQLKRCGLSVHLASTTPIRPQGWSDSTDAIQIRLARERFGDDKYRVVIWEETLKGTGISSEDAGAAQVLRGTGFEYLESLLSDLSRKHVEAAAPLPIRDKQDLAAVNAEASARSRHYIYVECVPEDRDRIEAIREYLGRHGLGLRTPLFEGEDTKRIKLNGMFLQKSSGVVVYFGKRNEFETCIACQDLSDLLGTRQKVPKAVVLDPLPDPVRSGFIFPDFDNYPVTGLDEFIRQVLQEDR